MNYLNIIRKPAVWLVFITSMSISPGCKETIEDISINPNRSVYANPENLLTTLSISAFGPDFYSITRYMDVYMMDNRFGGYHLSRDRGGFTGEYRQMTIAGDMIAAAERKSQPAYIPLGTFFKAWHVFNVTRLFGDVPYSEANKIHEGISLPKYDKQEDIIATILTELAEANTQLAALENTAKVSGDIIYNGDLKKWRKLINTFRLRVLINCSTQQNINGQSVAAQFAAIVNDPAGNPIMTKLDESPIRYEDGNPQNYVYYSDNNFLSSYRITQFVAEYMKDRNDYRLTVFAQPTIHAESINADPMDLNNYIGNDPFPNLQNNINYQLESTKKVSRLNKRYYGNPIGPPTMAIGYPEQQFILAEAALRGWIGGSADAFFEEGIKASFGYFGVGDRAALYLATPGVKLTGTNSAKLKQIITEKYFNFFMQGGYEPYFELIRTGYPDFKEYLTPDISTLYNSGRLPLRYLYPLGEITNNQNSVSVAVSRLNLGDNIFSKSWWIQGTDPLRNPDPFPYQ